VDGSSVAQRGRDADVDVDDARRAVAASILFVVMEVVDPVIR
jgi:hypothetical protein